jgi:hypothetical protein
MKGPLRLASARLYLADCCSPTSDHASPQLPPFFAEHRVLSLLVSPSLGTSSLFFYIYNLSILLSTGYLPYVLQIESAADFVFGSISLRTETHLHSHSPSIIAL